MPESVDGQKTVMIPGGAITRSGSGEAVGWGFGDPTTRKFVDLQVQSIRLAVYSKSGKGGLVVHKV